MNQFVAFHQAEEGLELTRNMRDSNWLQNRSWRAGLADGTYEVAFATSCPGNGPSWCLVPVAPRATPSAPNRTITLAIGDDGVMHVTSTVDYQDRGSPKSISLSTELTDWKKGPL